MKFFDNLKKEDRVGIYVSGGIHLALLAFFILYTFSIKKRMRPSYMEVQIGRFKTGTIAQHAKVKHKKVAKSPTPSKKKPEKPQPRHPKPKKAQKQSTKKTTKPVKAPKQKQKVKAKELKTPKTKHVNPKKKTAKKEKKEVKSNEKTAENKPQKAVIPPRARLAKNHKKGARKSGSKKGTQGKVNADQGPGSQKKKSAPYNLNIQGIDRTPMAQPLPKNSSNYDATITLRFQVTPQGKVVNIFPLHKSGNPNVDRQVIETLRKWRFSPLPPKAPKENQTGTITFHFVLH